MLTVSILNFPLLTREPLARTTMSIHVNSATTGPVALKFFSGDLSG
jgi:hypothetical protein